MRRAFGTEYMYVNTIIIQIYLKKTGCVTVPGNLSVDTTAQYPKEILNICCVRWWSLVSVRISPLRAPAYDGGIPLFFVFLTSLPLYY